MLEVKELTIAIQDKVLIENLNFTLSSGDKLAIIGDEGTGKSTLLKAILRNLDSSWVHGKIKYSAKQIGYLKQSLDGEDENMLVYDYLFEDQDTYYHQINDYYKLVKQLNIKEDLLDSAMMKNLSGGEKVKIQLLKILLNHPDLLLLDEPTNDLDLKTVLWLEQFIKKQTIPIIYVSHDEYLLKNTANQILHLELVHNKTKPRHTYKIMGYDEYLKERHRWIDKTTMVAKKEAAQYRKKEEKLKQIMNKVEYQQEHISRSLPSVGRKLKKKMHTLKAQEQKMEQMERTEIPEVEESIFFRFEKTNLPNRKEILKLDLPVLQVSKRILSQNIKLTILGNNHIVIVGENGVGKSTLLKYIEKELKTRKDIKVGYMPQNYEEVWEISDTPVSYLMGSDHPEYLIRSYLGNMKFSKEEMTSPIRNLSGGTKAKLLLLKFVLDRCDVLLLDEPTRNVSPLSIPVICQMLKEFDGAIISISHDRYFMEQVGEEIYQLTSQGLKKEL